MALAATCLWDSLDDVKPWLKLPLTTVEHDAVLEHLANAVTEALEAATGRIFVSRSITEIWSGESLTQGLSASGVRVGTRLPLRGYPGVVVSSFTVDDVAVPASDYVLAANTGVIRFVSRVITCDLGNLVITYTAGYARASLPARVTQIGLEMLRHRYQDWAANADHVSTLTLGGQQYIPQSTWPYHVKDTLDALRVEYRAGW